MSINLGIISYADIEFRMKTNRLSAVMINSVTYSHSWRLHIMHPNCDKVCQKVIFNSVFYFLQSISFFRYSNRLIDAFFSSDPFIYLLCTFSHVHIQFTIQNRFHVDVMHHVSIFSSLKMWWERIWSMALLFPITS